MYKTEEFLAKIAENPTAELSKAIMKKTLEGISPVFAREAVFFAARGAEITAEQLSGDTADRLWFYFSKVRDSINDGTNVYTVLKTKEGNLKDFLLLRYHAVWCAHGDKKLRVAKRSSGLFLCGEGLSFKNKAESQRPFFKLLINTSERTQRRVQNQREELKECKDREKNTAFTVTLSLQISMHLKRAWRMLRCRTFMTRTALQ